MMEVEEEQKSEGGGKRSVMMWECVQPYILNIFANFCFAEYNIVSKVSLDKGMSRYVLVVYSDAIGTLITAFLVLLFERTKGIMINRAIFCNIFFLGILRPIFGRMLCYAGLEYISPTIASSLRNLLPSITFILAILCRMEKLDIRKRSSQAKTGGTLVALVGATLMTLYKGTIVISPLRLPHYSTAQKVFLDDDWIKGSLLLTTSNLSLAGFFILQASDELGAKWSFSFNNM